MECQCGPEVLDPDGSLGELVNSWNTLSILPAIGDVSAAASRERRIKAEVKNFLAEGCFQADYKKFGFRRILMGLSTIHFCATQRCLYD